MKFTAEQIEWLKAKLSREHVATRKQAGRSLSYIEGWHAIAEANRIFGFDGWSSETVDIRMVSERERKIGQDGASGWGVSYVARVRITVGTIIREGVGSGHGIDRDLGQAHESAIKEAETDARKRALMTFGNQFGLALYDKTQSDVSDEQPAAPAVKDFKHLHKDGAHPWRGPVPTDQPVANPTPAAPPAAGSLSQPKKEEPTGASNPNSPRNPDPSAATRPVAQNRVAAIPTVQPAQSRAGAELEKQHSARVSGNLLAALMLRQRAVKRGVADLAVTAADHEAWKVKAKADWHHMTGVDQRRVKAAQTEFETVLASAIAARNDARDAGADEETGELPLAAE
jgi:DNA repair and recombination protein RAD52